MRTDYRKGVSWDCQVCAVNERKTRTKKGHFVAGDCRNDGLRLPHSRQLNADIPEVLAAGPKQCPPSETQMQRRNALFVAIVMTLSAATGLSTLGHSIVLAADNCLKQPDLQSPQGVHWYYHTDPVSNRKCWYMGRPGVKVPQAALLASPSPPKSKNGSDIKQVLDAGYLDNGEASHKLGISVDKADRDALFREFVLWQAQHMDAEGAQ